MPTIIEGGIAVLFAAAVYGAFFVAAGAQLRRALFADEGPGMRAFYAVAVVAISAIVWVMVGAVVYWGILLWFRFFLQEPQPWRQQLLDRTRWFPAGLLVTTPLFKGEAGRALAVVLGYPATLLLAAGAVALWRHGRRDGTGSAAADGILTTLDERRETNRYDTHKKGVRG